MDDEIWEPIAGWEGYYEVSTHGRVRSLDRTIPNGRGLRGQRRIKGRILKPSAGTDYMPYLIVTLQRGGRRDNPQCEIVMPYVHTLVLETFVGPRPPGMVACHDPDPSPANNRLDNLRWDTQRENQHDSIRHGTHARGRFKRLSEAARQSILERKARGESSLAVAAAIGCHRETVDRHWRKSRDC